MCGGLLVSLLVSLDGKVPIILAGRRGGNRGVLVRVHDDDVLCHLGTDVVVSKRSGDSGGVVSVSGDDKILIKMLLIERNAKNWHGLFLFELLEKKEGAEYTLDALRGEQVSRLKDPRNGY
jgi:ribosomal protein L14E/L6E/L27E